jgi:hypothetical protein
VFARIVACAFLLLALSSSLALSASQEKDPPALDPFGPKETNENQVPGYVTLSDGTIFPGQVFLTRDHRFRIFDAKAERFREVPLQAIRRVDCKVLKEWLEKEWRFKENANDAKVYTGRSYPVREYRHSITLKDGRKIEGPLAAIVYVQGEGKAAERFLLHKRDKGDAGTSLRALVYVKTISLGDKALKEGTRARKKLVRQR